MPSLASISSVSSAIPTLPTIQNPATPAPMTPMTPASADPGVVPQLQYVYTHFELITDTCFIFFFLILRNIVSTVNLGCRLDLKTIALHARNAEFNPKRFAAVIMRIREPRTTALIFSSGKMVCTGAKSEEDSRLAARKYARIIQKLNFPVSFVNVYILKSFYFYFIINFNQAKFLDFKIQNMVGSCDVKFPIRLEGLVLTHGQFSRLFLF